MKPKSSAVTKRLAPIVLAVTSQLIAQPANSVAAHRTEREVTDSVKAALPFLEDKVASTIKDGSSAPIAFHGQAQLRTLFYKYTGIPDSSYLRKTQQGFIFGADDPVLRLGMVVTPGRNTVMWATGGLMASYPGINPKASFVERKKPVLDANGIVKDSVSLYDYGYSPMFQHHSSNKKTGVIEDLSAGIAIRTKPASFMLKMGAMNWNEASPLSIWKAQPRMFAWEYLPYEIEEPISEYYGYNLAKGEKAGRAAWNKRAFQGVDFSVSELPGDFTGYFLYGSGMPYDNYERNAMDMAVDLGYAGDEGSIIETGIGDSYRKQLYYRIAKPITPKFQLGFNNGYVITDDDIVASGFKYQYVFNDKFDVGLYGSTWDINNERVTITDAESYKKVLAESSKEDALSIGRGYWLEPKVFSVDAKGQIGNKWSYFADLGFSSVETTYVSIDNSNAKKLSKSSGSFALIQDDYSAAAKPSDIKPGAIESITSSQFMKGADLASYLQLTYTSKVTASVDLFYAGDKFYSPNSFVLPTDIFYARGSNMLGAQKFLGAEASPYARNMMAVGVEVKPNLPWYGHLKAKYGINSQVKAARDVILFPYRLNGASVVSTFNNFYSRWGTGRITETYDFTYNQGLDPTKLTETFAKQPISRLGDESYGTHIGKTTYEGLSYGARTILSPTSGGLRADANSLMEGFVPYTKAEDAIFNYFAKSSLVEQKRDLSQIWSDTAVIAKKNPFVDMRSKISNIRVTDGENVQFYTLNTTSGLLEIRNDSAGAVVETKEVSTVSETGFVPVNQKSSFDFSVDWGLDIGKYIGYKNDLFLSLYYEINGITKGIKPIAFSDESEDVLLLSHYIRTEPAIALTKNFYLLGLFGFERWNSGHSWVAEYDSIGAMTGFKKSELETTDLALGIGFDWDMVKRVGLHGRYKWYSHEDAAFEEMKFKNHSVSLELKSYF